MRKRAYLTKQAFKKLVYLLSKKVNGEVRVLRVSEYKIPNSYIVDFFIPSSEEYKQAIVNLNTNYVKLWGE